MTSRNPAGRCSWVDACCTLAALVAAAAFAPAQNKTVPPVAAASLQKLMPAVDGWTAGIARADLIEISPEAKYSVASQTFTKDDQRVRLTIADTGFSPESLTALASMIVAMPEDYAGQVGSLAIKRLLIGGSPAVEAWDAQKSAGEVAVVVGGRFVVALEAPKIDSVATLRGMLDKIDLKALAALK
jgi:hypothetical protein